MTDARISGYVFDKVDKAGRRCAGQESFNASMLKAKLYLQMEDIFAVALEAEMPRLDDTGMHRTNRYFMHFLPFCHKVVCFRRTGAFAPGIVGWRAEAHGFEPGMPNGADTPCFKQFALEQMRLGA